MWNRMSRAERIAAIRSGILDGKSTSKIAASIGGCTRNAVIGLAHRAKLQLGPQSRFRGGVEGRAAESPTQTAPKRSPPFKPPRQSSAQAAVDTALVKALPISITGEPTYEFPDAHYQVHLEDVANGRCRYPTWGNEKRPGTEVYFYCGKPVKEGSPYCWHCHKKTHDPTVGPTRKPRLKHSARLTMRGDLA